METICEAVKCLASDQGKREVIVYLKSLLISLINVCANIYVICNRKFIIAQWSTENTSCFNFFVYLFSNLVTPGFQHGASLVIIIAIKNSTHIAGDAVL